MLDTSTAGGNSEANVQPLTARIGGIPVSISHNGNIVNAEQIRQNLETAGTIYKLLPIPNYFTHLMACIAIKEFIAKLMHAFDELFAPFLYYY